MANVAIQKAPGPRSTAHFATQVAREREAVAATIFDPAKHLSFVPPKGVVTMEDLGFAPGVGVSPVAVSQPFQLFPPEAIKAMRKEIMADEVQKNCSYSSNVADRQLRGYVAQHAPFAYAAWTNSRTLEIVSSIAGIDLVPVMDYEIAHINMCHKSAKQIEAEREAVQSNNANDKPIVGWHVDSYPFVVVTMLSDCTGMIGGETALRTAKGEILKVRGPSMGCAVVLQGRYITHQALRTLGGTERITSVTSFRPRSPLLKDDSVLTTVRGISNLSELYHGYADYRTQIVSERFSTYLRQLRTDRSAGHPFATADFKAFLQAQIAFIEHTNKEIVPDEDVPRGFVPTMDQVEAVVVVSKRLRDLSTKG